MSVAGAKARVYVGGFDLSYFLRNAKISKSRDAPDTTTYKSVLQPDGAEFKEFLATLKSGSASLEGNYAGGIGEVEPVFDAAFESPAPVTTIALEDVLGGPAYCFLANGTAWDLIPPVEGIVGISAAFQASQGLERGLVSHPLGPETVGGNGGAIDNLEATLGGGGVAYLQVIEFVGTDCTVKVADSANGSTYADLITFDPVTVEGVAQRKAVSGTVRQFTRWVISGTFTSITFQLVVIRK